MEGRWFGGRGLAVAVELQGVDRVRGRRAWWSKFPVQIGERWSGRLMTWKDVHLVVDVEVWELSAQQGRYKTGKVAGELFDSRPRLLQSPEVAPGRGAQTVLLVLNSISAQQLLWPSEQPASWFFPRWFVSPHSGLSHFHGAAACNVDAAGTHTHATSTTCVGILAP